MTVSLPAYAKINRDLRILGRDAEGYHLIASVFESIALHDTVSVAESGGPLTVTCSDPTLPTDDRNLVTRAARAWCALHRGGVTDGLRIHVDKRIPMQAGLGGGSADAAATLLALTMIECRLAEVAAAPAALTDADRQVAARLGADVAFFLVGGRALATGRGERLRPLDDTPSAAVVLARPGFGVSTVEAYGWFDAQADLAPGQMLGRDGRAVGAPDDAASPAVGRRPAVPTCLPPPSRGCANELEPPVAARHPAIGHLAAALRRCGARQAAMTGSGSVVFGVFDRPGEAAAGASATTALGAAVWQTATLPRRLYWGGGA